MKKVVLPVLVSLAIIFAGCFDNTSEVTLKEDGTGTVSNVFDMSTLVALAKQMGSADKLGKMDEAITDTSFSLASKVDSIAGLSPDEKAMLKKGTARLNTDMKNDKFVVSFNFPIASLAEIAISNKVSDKILNETLKKFLVGIPPEAMADMPEPSSFDNYYVTTYEKDGINRTLDKVKFANVESDEYLKGLKEAGSMGLEIASTLVINLPRPATKVEGANVKLSDDKKKLTLKATLDDFFDHPEKLEFKVKY